MPKNPTVDALHPKDAIDVIHPMNAHTKKDVKGAKDAIFGGKEWGMMLRKYEA